MRTHRPCLRPVCSLLSLLLLSVSTSVADEQADAEYRKVIEGRAAKIVATLGPASSTPKTIEALFVAGVFWIGIQVTVLICFMEYQAVSGSDGSTAGPVARALGETGAVGLTAFHLACTGYYIHYVARAVPTLYRVYELLLDHGSEVHRDPKVP